MPKCVPASNAAKSSGQSEIQKAIAKKDVTIAETQDLIRIDMKRRDFLKFISGVPFAPSLLALKPKIRIIPNTTEETDQFDVFDFLLKSIDDLAASHIFISHIYVSENIGDMLVERVNQTCIWPLREITTLNDMCFYFTGIPVTATNTLEANMVALALHNWGPHGIGYIVRSVYV